MEQNLHYKHYPIFWRIFWRIFCLIACLPLPLLATTLAPNFPFTEPEFETIRDAQAIDNQTTTALAQDAHGLIWIATQTGLVRYDGYRFRKFVHNAADPFSLAGNYIASLSIAKDGRIWNGTNSDGISIFDPTTERFEHFQHDEKQPHSLSGGRIFALSNDGQGGMWIATNQGLDHQIAGTSRFVHFKHSLDPNSLLNNKVHSLLLDKAGRLWVGSSSGLQRLTQDGKGFETILQDTSVQTLFQAQDGKLWLGTPNNGAAWLDATNEPRWLPLAQLSYPAIARFAQVRADQILLACDGGGIIVVAASDGQVLQTLRHDPVLPGSLKFDNPRVMLVDRAGWLWVGTWSGSLQRTNLNNSLMRTLRHSINRPNGLSHPDVRSLLELADGRLLIGTNGNGIDIFDQQRGLIGGFRAERNQPGALPDAKVFALAQTSDGAIWAGTQQAGVVRQLPGSTAWVPVPGLPEKRVRTLLVSRDGSLWAATAGGVARVPPPQAPHSRPDGNAALAAAQFETLTDEQGKVMQASAYALAEDGQGQIWIATNNGLWLHQPNSRSLIHIPAEPTRPDGLISNDTNGLLYDSRGSLWVATDKGLERLKSRDSKLARFQHINDLLRQEAVILLGNLMEDQQGRIWTDAAVIDQISPTSIRARMNGLTPADGIDNKTIWLGSYTKTRNGLLLFGGTEGVMIIDPTGFKPYEYIPTLIVTELKINGKIAVPPLFVSPASQTNTQAKSSPPANLTLSAAQRNFAIEFSALDYSAPEKNRYQYRLQGYDKDWISTDAEHRSAAYGNLWPGKYTLQIRGSNRLGKWSPHELMIPIRVLPAWWQTGWFGLVLLLSISAAIAALWRTRTRYLRQRQRELEQLVHERTYQLRQKQDELVDANHELNQSNGALSDAITALNQSNEDLLLSVETLRQLGDIGREITANLDADIVFQSLYQYVGGLLDAPAMMIYRLNTAGTTLIAVFGREDEHIIHINNIAIDSPGSNAARTARERQELLVDYAPVANPLDDPHHIPGTRHMLTALFSPLIVDDKVLGVMSIQSDKQYVYGERERLIFRTLTAYGAIALANAAAMLALRQAQGQLVQQEKMASLGGLLAGIAHEINTPLGNAMLAISGAEGAWKTLQNAVISGHISKSVLKSSTTAGMEYNTLALKTATRAAELIALFKTISVNPDSDRPLEIELSDYLQEIATLVQAQLEQNACKLVLTAPIGLCVYAVPEALTETLSRILVNVLDHAFDQGRTGTVRLHAQIDAGDGENQEGNHVIISVSDNGHGIAPEDLPKVFDPFFTTKSGLQGHVGLGLHVAYNHVTQRLKGQIKITSTLGEGTCVEIRLKMHGNA